MIYLLFLVGEVFKGTWNQTTPIALKKLKSNEFFEQFKHEAKILM